MGLVLFDTFSEGDFTKPDFFLISGNHVMLATTLPKLKALGPQTNSEHQFVVVIIRVNKKHEPA